MSSRQTLSARGPNSRLSRCAVLALLFIFVSVFAPPCHALQGQWGIHDPSRIIKRNGVYHIWGTGDQIYHLTSTDMVNWSTAATVFPPGTYPGWITTYTGTGFTGFFWAPDCVYVGGKYFMYYACSTWGSKRSAIGVATSTDLTNWTDQGLVVSSGDTSDFNAIDPSPLLDSAGRLWLVFGSFNSGIKIARCNTTTGKLVDSTRTSIASPAGAVWDVGENATVIQNGSYYYLFYNLGGCCSGTNSTYYVVMGRATSPTGPYYDKSGKTMTTAGSGTTVLSSSGRYIGPGSFGVFSENGVNFASYHFYDGWNDGVPLLGISRLTWDSSNWPVISQDWIANGTYTVVNPAFNKCWEAWGGTGASTSPVAMGTYSGLNSQKWAFTSVGDGYYKITSAQGGLALDAFGCSPDNGTKLDLYAYWGGNCQQWKAERCSDGTYVFSSANWGRVVDIPGGQTADGTQLNLWDSLGNAYQKWSVSVPAVLIPSPPTGLSATAGNAQVSLSWAATSGATSYNVKRATTSGGPYTTVASPTGTSHTNTGLANGIRYYYVVTAVNAGGESANSPQASATPQPPAPAAPTGVTAKAGNAKVSVSWNASANATSYTVKRATTNGGPYTNIATNSYTTNFLDSGLTNGTTYYYVVSAANGGGSSANSSQTSAAPGAASSLTLQAEDSILGGGTAVSTNTAGYKGTGYANYPVTGGTTTFNNVPGGTGGTAQLVLRFGLTGTASRTGTLAVNGISQAITFPPTVDWLNWSTIAVNVTLNAGTGNTLVIASTGGDLASVDEITVIPTGGISAVPAAPTGLGATAGNAQVALSWTASSGATSYNVKRATTSGGPYTTVSSPTGTSYTNTGLTNGTTYYYVVSAVNGGGESADSSQASATPQLPAPAAPTGLAATAGNGQVSLAWSASSGATSYNVKRATVSGGPYTTVAAQAGTSYVNTGLTNGTTYYYVVSAVNAGGEGGNSSQTSATPAAPVLSGLLAYEGFGYASGTSVANQTGGFGWGANWSNTGNAQDVSTAQPASLASGTLLGSGGSVKFGPSSAGGSSSSGVYMRQFADTLGSMAASGSGSVWLSLLYLNSTGSVDASGFYGEARIGLYSGVIATSGVTQTAGATQVVSTGTPATSATVLDRISLYNGATINATSVATPRGTTPALLLLKVVADNTTATDTVYLWVNPNLASGEPTIATANASWTTSDLSGVNGLRFQQAGTNGGVVTTVDEIRLGRTFGDVSPSSTLPSPWATADIGSVAAAGSAGQSSGVFTVAGSGTGLAGTADEFRSVHQAASGDCSIIARVTAVQNTSANAKAGVSIRESTADNAAQATCAVANGSVAFIYRTATGSSTTTVPVGGVNPPRWVRVDRTGDTFTAAYSSDGVNWTAVGSGGIAMTTSVTLGTVVTSQADGTLTSATLDNITATP